MVAAIIQIRRNKSMSTIKSRVDVEFSLKFNVKLSGIARTLKDVIAFYICTDAESSYQLFTSNSSNKNIDISQFI